MKIPNHRTEIALETLRILNESIAEAARKQDMRAYFALVDLLQKETAELLKASERRKNNVSKI